MTECKQASDNSYLVTSQLSRCPPRKKKQSNAWTPNMVNKSSDPLFVLSITNTQVCRVSTWIQHIQVNIKKQVSSRTLVFRFPHINANNYNLAQKKSWFAIPKFTWQAVMLLHHIRLYTKQSYKLTSIIFHVLFLTTFVIFILSTVVPHFLSQALFGHLNEVI